MGFRKAPRREQCGRVGAFSKTVRPAHASCFVAILAACSGSATNAPEPAPISGSAAPAPPVTACAVRGPDRDPSTGVSPPRADSVTIVGDEVKLCWAAQPVRTCWRIDTANKVFEAQPVTSDAPSRDVPLFVPQPHAKATLRADGTVSLCGPGGTPCKSFAKPIKAPPPEWLAVSDDLSTLAIPDGDVMRIFDVPTGRLRRTFKGWPDSPMSGGLGGFQDPPILATSDRIIVWYTWSPVSDQGRVFDIPSGKQLAVVGGTDFMAIDPHLNAWLVRGTEWAVKGEANTLVTIDARDPSITSTYDLTELLAQPRPPKDGDTGILDVSAVAGTAKGLIVVTDENPVTIGVVDRATKTVTRLDLPRCPQPPAAITKTGR